MFILPYKYKKNPLIMRWQNGKWYENNSSLHHRESMSSYHKGELKTVQPGSLSRYYPPNNLLVVYRQNNQIIYICNSLTNIQYEK